MLFRCVCVSTRSAHAKQRSHARCLLVCCLSFALGRALINLAQHVLLPVGLYMPRHSSHWQRFDLALIAAARRGSASWSLPTLPYLLLVCPALVRELLNARTQLESSCQSANIAELRVVLPVCLPACLSVCLSVCCLVRRSQGAAVVSLCSLHRRAPRSIHRYSTHGGLLSDSAAATRWDGRS